MTEDRFKIGDKIMGLQTEDQLQKYSSGIYAGTIVNIGEINKEHYHGIEYYFIDPLPGSQVRCIENSGVIAFDAERWKKLKELYDKKIAADKELWDFVSHKGGLHS